MTKFETLTIAAKSAAHTIASLPIDKAAIADWVEPLLHGLSDRPSAAFYLMAAIVAKLRHADLWIVYLLICLKALLSGH